MSEVKKLKTRDEIDSTHKWKVEKMYKNSAAWEEDFEILKSKAPNMQRFSGKLGRAEDLLSFLESNVEILRLLDKLLVYAHLRGDEDTAKAEFQILKNKIDAYEAEASSITAFFIPELLSLPEGAVDEAICKLPELKIYEFYLKDILSQKPHTLSAEGEKLLASARDCLNAPENIFGMLTDADMTFPSIKDEKGNEVELTEGNYSTFIKSKDRRVRKDAFEALFGTYRGFKNTLTTSLTSSIKNFIFNTKTRNYTCALESSLKPNNIPVEVYHNVVDTINNNLSSLHKYVSLKKKLLGLDEIHMYDLYVPIVDAKEDHIEYEDAVKIVLDGIRPLGQEYLSIFKEGISEGWVDIFQNKGKCGGAYSGGCYDSMPYVLLNYNYQLNDVSTLAHEMGHSIHSYYSRKTQPYIYSEYVLFCAEVASTTNECLLIDYLIKNETDKKRRLFLINEQLEGIRTTVFRQCMFAEFEKITHENIEGGNPLSPDDLCKIYHDLNVKYFGAEMVVDEGIDMEWSRIPHFYSDFYVYQYTTGFAAANSFSKMIVEEGESAVERYKDFLKSGGSDYPINILKKAGVDMSTPKPLEDTIRRFDELLEMLEKEI
ncbi:oligoendopeptidase F [Clostridium sp. FP2]|uniref:oligoendopeptidase F n=1 Tax=Clostridium TaxID=1485 RepID=UPI0013E928B6|nr:MULTISPECIES: oligoendopeptidase F [Clostridium]MBW9156722.1 oligoendopeptidase F [Clostridium tagluense]MBZ9625088.1 oligoendopeptidase F [Clostridium sp. FP2]WLC64879.1 oligoendopeptidase F [Clostridium tagluense]